MSSPPHSNKRPRAEEPSDDLYQRMNRYLRAVPAQGLAGALASYSLTSPPPHDEVDHQVSMRTISDVMVVKKKQKLTNTTPEDEAGTDNCGDGNGATAVEKKVTVKVEGRDGDTVSETVEIQQNLGPWTKDKHHEFVKAHRKHGRK